MCDTWVAMGDISVRPGSVSPSRQNDGPDAGLPDGTTTGTVIFGKNSDRPIDDCQPLVYNPPKIWPNGSSLELE